jgi:predicted phage-related endonuclease
MKVHNVVQGTPEWLALRTEYFTASEAAAMMGCDPNGKTRNQLLAEKKSGFAPEVSQFVEERIFAKGHAAEAAFLPIAESLIGDDLYPCVGTLEVEDLPLLASFDGLTMDQLMGYEHKLWNEDIANAIRTTGEPPNGYVWQLEHQLLVSGASTILFVTSDGTEGVSTHTWYCSSESRRAALISGWKQFQTDLAAYTPAPKDNPKPTGHAPDTLPALRIEVTGMVTASNLEDFRATALKAIRSVNRNLSTDQDFADAESSVKWCSDVETRLAAAKAHALSQTESIDALFRTIDQISAEARKVRLDLEKLVKTEKDSIRLKIQEAAYGKLRTQIQEANSTADRLCVVAPQSDANQRIAAAMKGKRSVESLQNAADTEVAKMLIEAKAVIEQRTATIEAWDKALAAHSAPIVLQGLCPDLPALLMNTPDNLRLIVKSRWSEYEAAQAEKAKKEQEAREAAAAIAVVAQAPRPEQAPMFEAAQTPAQPQVTVLQQAHKMLKLGDLNALIAPLQISAEGLAALGFLPAGTDRASKLYKATDVPAICNCMANHLIKVMHTA